MQILTPCSLIKPDKRYLLSKESVPITSTNCKQQAYYTVRVCDKTAVFTTCCSRFPYLKIDGPVCCCLTSGLCLDDAPKIAIIQKKNVYIESCRFSFFLSFSCTSNYIIVGAASREDYTRRSGFLLAGQV